MKDPIVEQSRRMIREGSKSFAGAARLLPASARHSVYMLYAWCRDRDDQIDQQDLGRNRPVEAAASRAVLRDLQEKTDRALAGERVDENIFIALNRVVTRHRIPHEHPRELLHGFAMDVDHHRFEQLEDSLSYCYHVAGVVGVMMAHIMDSRDQEALDRAADLGIALQMTNIARDVLDDAAAGRIYLPLAWLDEAGVPAGEIAERKHRRALHGVVRRFLDTAELYYHSASVGLSWLSPRCAWAIATARGVYREIGRVVIEREERAWDTRTIVARPRKVARALYAGLEAALAVGLRHRRRSAAPRTGLWSRTEIRGE